MRNSSAASSSKSDLMFMRIARHCHYFIGTLGTHAILPLSRHECTARRRAETGRARCEGSRKPWHSGGGRAAVLGVSARAALYRSSRKGRDW